MELAFIPISALLAFSIYLAGKAGRKPLAVVLWVVAVVAALINEFALRRFHPGYNIRLDLLILIPLALVAVSRIAFPLVPEQSRTPASRLASSSLTYGLVGMVIVIIPVLGALAAFKGHQALRAGLHGPDRLKAIIALFLGYGQIATAIYLWTMP